METRRSFIKKAAIFSGSTAMLPVLPEAIQRALDIQPAEGSTYLDAKHIVVLMQENRSFDHAFGRLKGVRGFNDPRAIDLPNGHKVWMQTNNAGETYAPFRLGLKETKATWMSSLPHSWENMVDARNGGKYDQWLEAKKSGRKEYGKMPLTMGYYDRKDLPFYYALADAFTVCDYNFCSSLTGTTANRHYLWTGIARDLRYPDSKACVHNGDVTYHRWASWKTFPERLEEKGISWAVYQNELSMPVGFEGEESSWLANFTDNNLEWFSQYHVMFSEGFQNYLTKLIEVLPVTIQSLEDELQNYTPKDKQYGMILEKMEQAVKDLSQALERKKMFNREKFEQLPEFEQNLHRKAFVTNKNDPHYHDIESFVYNDQGEQREMKLPKGDILHQFRADVDAGTLPAVSWICAPKNFSDHPSAPWYGAWYISEVMDILTKNPEVWKQTIFIITYDENDGYFDHIPPFVPPHPEKGSEGKISDTLDARSEFAHMKHELERHKDQPERARDGAVGLGFRVPMLIVSPWSKGGYVNSEVCDHTSVLQLMEDVLNHQTGKGIKETNISSWRRSICSNLASAFRPYYGEAIPTPEATNREVFAQSIHQAQFKELPNSYKVLTPQEINSINSDALTSPHMVSQEKGIKNSNILPYHMSVQGEVKSDGGSFVLRMKSDASLLGSRAAGIPYIVYALGGYKKSIEEDYESVQVWNYTVAGGDELIDEFPLSQFEGDTYHFRVYGPNGFFREFKGAIPFTDLKVESFYELTGRRTKKLSGNLGLVFKNSGKEKQTILIEDKVYGGKSKSIVLSDGQSSGSEKTLIMNLQKQYGWYDIEIKIQHGTNFSYRLSGRVESEISTKTDPYMGGIL